MSLRLIKKWNCDNKCNIWWSSVYKKLRKDIPEIGDSGFEFWDGFAFLIGILKKYMWIFI